MKISLFIRKWYIRRVVVTKNTIAVAHVGDDSIIDNIPISEIEQVDDLSTVEDSKDLEKKTLSSAYQMLYAASLRIKTKARGQKGGRSFYLRAQDPLVCAQLVAQLNRSAKSAARTDIRRTPFQQSRDNVRKLYESTAWQTAAALLYITVWFDSAAQLLCIESMHSF